MAKLKADALSNVPVKSVHATTKEKVKELPPGNTPTVAPTDVAETLRARGDKYGTFVGHATVTQALKRIVYEHAKAHDKTFTDDQVEALDMILHKVGRIVNGDPNYADSWVDIAGYAKLVSDRLETGLIV